MRVHKNATVEIWLGGVTFCRSFRVFFDFLLNQIFFPRKAPQLLTTIGQAAFQFIIRSTYSKLIIVSWCLSTMLSGNSSARQVDFNKKFKSTFSWWLSYYRLDRMRIYSCYFFWKRINDHLKLKEQIPRSISWTKIQFRHLLEFKGILPMYSL